jgi:hypothetical protein
MSEGQATLQMTGEQRIDEHGTRDRWDRGGVYDAAGELDLHATEDELADRFADTDERLPDEVGDYERKPSQNDHSAVYYWSGEGEDEHGVRVTERFVRVYPRGPYLHEWTVDVEERNPDHATGAASGWAYRTHPHAQGLDDPTAAAAVALAFMRGEPAARDLSCSGGGGGGD